MNSRLYENAALIACGVLLAAGCATVQTTDATTVAATEEANVEETETQTTADAVADYGRDDYDPYEIICKRRKATGTRVAKFKDCRTAEQWRKSGQNATRAVDELKNYGTDEPFGR